MNYVSAVYFIVVLIIVADWFLRGKKEYRGQATRHEEVEVARRDSVVDADAVVR
jgi:choline transport protein